MADKSLYRVAPNQVNQTLAALLRQWLPSAPSWTAVQKLLRRRHVLVNGNLCCDAGRRLKVTDVVRVLDHPTAPVADERSVRIRYLDRDVVVVEKPSGMTSVRHREEQGWSDRRKDDQPTLEDLLPRVIARLEGAKRQKRPAKHRQPQGGKRPARSHPVRPVHRLDRETSGLMIFARNIPAERSLGMQFRKHTTSRRYLAVALGHVRACTIESQLVRDRGDGRRGSTKLANTGKRAVTHVKPIEHFDGYTLIECELETGRTHQIRIHLAERGHPICGDKVYGQPLHKEPIADRSGAPRLALHACDLAFEHPTTHEQVEYHMPLPDDLRQFVDRLRGKSREKSAEQD